MATIPKNKNPGVVIPHQDDIAPKFAFTLNLAH